LETFTVAVPPEEAEAAPADVLLEPHAARPITATVAQANAVSTPPRR
jgi:hypothetical protein